VVDLDALAEALKQGRLGGAAIDVYPREPARNDEPFDCPLRGMPNVVLTPHIAGATVEAQENIGLEVARKLSAYAATGDTASAVNFPRLLLSPPTTGFRLLHVHRNVPGVVRQINDLVADENLNVAGQQLQTLGDLGYVALDVEGAASPALLDAVRAVKGTIRARVVRG
jgi:D-3-phosphoglycerate dehydrogenase